MDKDIKNATKLTNVKKYKDFLMVAIQTIITLAVALVLTVFSCGFDFNKINWITFAFNFIFSTAMRMIYSNYAKNKEKETDEIMVLRNTISEDRKAIYSCQKTQEFEMEIERINNINRLEAYIIKLDSKEKLSDYEKEQRSWAFNYKVALEKEMDVFKYEEKRSIKSVKVNYERIEPSKLFTYGVKEGAQKSKYSFSSWASSLNRAVIPTAFSLIASIVFSAISNPEYLKSGQAWIDLVSYLFSMGMGAWWGLTNGKAIIREDYAEVLNNVAFIVRQVKTKIIDGKPSTPVQKVETIRVTMPKPQKKE